MLQLGQSVGSAMRPFCTSTLASERQTEQRKNASDSSGTRCDVRITIPVIVIS